MTQNGRTDEQASYRVVVTDHAYPDLDTERDVLAGVGASLEAVQLRTPAELEPVVRDADALLVQFATIDRRVIGALERCRVIVRYGIGVDNIDVVAAREHDIPVANVPDYGLDEVADHAMALLLALARKLRCVAERVRAGQWEPNPCRPMTSLRERTLGLAGFGRIARRVAARAAAFGVRVQAYDPYVDEATFVAHGAERVDWQGLLSSSDLLSLHLPLVEETRHLFDARAFASMKPGVLLVNTARGAVIDTDALLEALDDGTVAAAGLDVLEQEPPTATDPILHHPRALVTSHCAWYTEESRQRLQRLAAEEVARVLRGERPKNVVQVDPHEGP